MPFDMPIYYAPDFTKAQFIDAPNVTYAVAEKDGTRVEVPIGAPYLLVNGKRVEMDTTAQIVDTRTYLPIRPVMEAFGAYVTWDNANRLVVIKTGSSDLPENTDAVHFIDVGQGDCILIDCGETEVLIDGGNNGAGDEVVSYLTPYIDGKLDYLIATHPDADHVGGLDAVLEAFEVGEVIDSGRKSDTDTYKDYWAAVQAEGCTISYGEDRIIPLSSLAALSILETGNDWEDSNDCSVVAQLTCGNVQVLFTGDMSQQVETKLLPLFGDIDVLKVSHHGSDTASCAEFLSVVKPEYAVISYGLDNAYHHPAGETSSMWGPRSTERERAAPSSSPPTAGHTASTPPRRSPPQTRVSEALSED